MSGLLKLFLATVTIAIAVHQGQCFPAASSVGQSSAQHAQQQGEFDREKSSSASSVSSSSKQQSHEKSGSASGVFAGSTNQNALSGVGGVGGLGALGGGILGGAASSANSDASLLDAASRTFSEKSSSSSSNYNAAQKSDYERESGSFGAATSDVGRAGAFNVQG